MKRKSAELKRLARESLRGCWGLIIGATVLLNLIVVVLEIPFYIMAFLSGGDGIQSIIFYLATTIIAVASSVLQAGQIKMYLNMARGQKVDLGMMFLQFTNRPDRFIVGQLLILGICLVCLLPGYICLSVGVYQDQIAAVLIGMGLIIAGMVIYMVTLLRYALVMYLLVEFPHMKVMEAFRESSRIMDGNKGRSFYITLSFIGWSFLGMFSCGIGMLWVTPYMWQTMTCFYLDVTGELDRKAALEDSGFQQQMPGTEQEQNL